MKIQCQSYKRTLDTVAKRIFDHTEDMDRAVSKIVMSTGVPTIVVYQYAIQFIYGEHPTLLAGIDRLTKFYNYTELEIFENNENSS